MTKKQPFFNGLYDFVALKLSKSRGNIGEDLNSGETRTITSSTKGNLSDASYKTITEYGE